MRSRAHALFALVVVAIWSCSGQDALGQTRVNYGLSGVSLSVGRVNINVQSGGRVTTSVPVGRMWFHQSNYGLGGLTYDSPTGRLDSITDYQRRRSYAWHTSYPRARADNRIDWKLNTIRPPHRHPPVSGFGGVPNGKLGW